jgi:hypothetical protein
MHQVTVRVRRSLPGTGSSFSHRRIPAAAAFDFPLADDLEHHDGWLSLSPDPSWLRESNFRSER